MSSLIEKWVGSHMSSCIIVGQNYNWQSKLKPKPPNIVQLGYPKAKIPHLRRSKQALNVMGIFLWKMKIFFSMRNSGFSIVPLHCCLPYSFCFIFLWKVLLFWSVSAFHNSSEKNLRLQLTRGRKSAGPI